MTSEIFPYRLEFKFPFRIAHTERTHTDNLYLLLSHQGRIGWGEAVFPPYMRETQAEAVKILSTLRWPGDPAGLDIPAFLAEVEKEVPSSPCLLAAVDMALHNLQSAVTGKSIRDKYAISGQIPATSVTLGISSKREMEEKIKSAAGAAYFKLKIDEQSIGRMVGEYLALCDKPFVVDANQGFRSIAAAAAWTEKLHKLNVAYLEQPFHKDDLDSHRRLREKSPIPIIADESFQRLSDLDRLVDSFDGVNVKLMKSGGIFEACQALRKIREAGLRSVIGCMSESSVAAGAAGQLAPLADWVDLDGPVLIKNDLFAPEAGYAHEEIIRRLKNE